jgi:hypothetical protein
MKKDTRWILETLGLCQMIRLIWLSIFSMMEFLIRRKELHLGHGYIMAVKRSVLKQDGIDILINVPGIPFLPTLNGIARLGAWKSSIGPSQLLCPIIQDGLALAMDPDIFQYLDSTHPFAMHDSIRFLPSPGTGLCSRIHLQLVEK